MIATLQRRAGRALRARVAGDDAPARAEVIWGSEGERWFTPEDPVWRVHADAAMFPGGVAALLLQMLHPLAMAGVGEHSGYRGDPWGRLQRTSHYLASTTFGTVEHATATIERVRSIHETVVGADRLGRPYAASDPHLLRWVHLAEIHCFLEAFQRYATAPLTPADADRYVAQTGVSAALLGVPDPPETVAGVEAGLAAYRSELEVTEGARDASRFLLLEPPLPWPARPGYWAIAAGGVALLPAWARGMLGIRRPAALAGRALGRPVTRSVSWAMAGVR